MGYDGNLKFSVVVCTYSMERLGDLLEALDSICHQSYPPQLIETVVVVDGNKTLYDRLAEMQIDAVLHLNEKNLGLSKSRTVGAELATGEVVAFMDDDAIADTNWISGLAEMYYKHDAVAAGGMLRPLWVAGKDEFIPPEYYWLIGATPKGTPEHVKEVRNTYGSNISFVRGIFLMVGGFNNAFGFNAGKNGILQGEEAELCNKVKALYGKGCMYNPKAVVFHKVFKSRTELKTLFRRAFWQGYSKRILKESSPESLGEESGFLEYVLFTSIPERIIGVIKNVHPWLNFKQLFFLVFLTATVGFGYLYRTLQNRVQRGKKAPAFRRGEFEPLHG